MISIHALLAESDLIGKATELTLELISIHALLAESDAFVTAITISSWLISIHALLAESDGHKPYYLFDTNNFNPRSPCGERPGAPAVRPGAGQFQSTLSLRRATCRFLLSYLKKQISIHALLAESDCCNLSTTWWTTYFNPRSPCGERLGNLGFMPVRMIFQSTLSLRRATRRCVSRWAL